MNSMNDGKKKYTIVKDPNVDLENNDSISVWKYIFYFGLLAMLCVLSFLVAKYIVRSNIEGEEIPIDTSERL